MSKKGSKVLGFLQRIGKSLMVPIAVMPALGLLLRLGDTDVLNIPWLKAAGNAAFGDNMAMLFAVGIGFGLSEDNNGVGGLAGLLGYLVMTNVATSFDPSIKMGAFGGVVAGVVGGLLYNKFKDIKVPQFLGFFGGKRFVPIITSAVCVALGVFFGYTWPTFQAGLDGFANIMVAAGALGAGIYGFLNRLLIPIGLHHVMNTVIWFQLGSFTNPVTGQLATGDISRYLAGDPTAGVYTAGFYPIMMFGLPAACLAMYVCAKKKNKAVVGGMFLSLALTAIITGITEPIEFAFMFLSPILYVIHAILTGISLAVAYALNVHLAFSFSGGLIDYVLYFGKGHNQLYLLAMGVVAFIIYYFLFVFFIKKFNLKTPGREDDFDEGNEDEPNTSGKVSKSDNNPSKGGTLAEKAEVVLAALGGKENIEVLDNCITRLRLTLKDASIIDEAALKKAGASGVMKLDGKNVQVIMGTLADPLASQMKKLL
ncbi:N-acetylglucosamine-specific PTS transporter subunit IIBC [Clostridium sp. LIBA-8841]|uniref:N-acetylglucosamine-specific PTS transporter subunit IIBC n=1 Tax=Clostridium sp. LIBA-8841 TaxID=2987530 RepID=UPI002AC45664|nr:N-acetylglucosamine-specific PTS transporter subunit IIBC [Clostridium sp. LIBA-8841]MDZ5255380.1 N-acetylglucosamine-specific PTS transporter subunit IIBC [Clostridium sp. LIBA-8841]